MKFLFDYVLEKQPWLIRWTFYVMIGLVTLLGGAFTLGWQAAPYANAFIDVRIEEKVDPKLGIMDQKITGLHERFSDNREHFDVKFKTIENQLNVLIAR